MFYKCYILQDEIKKNNHRIYFCIYTYNTILIGVIIKSKLVNFFN